MHARKGSFTLTQPRARRHLRWSGLLTLLFFSLLYIKRSEFHVWFIPEFPPPNPASLQKCPANPPYPALVQPPNDKFSWRSIPQQYPVESLAQLPKGRNNNLPKIQYDFRKEETPLYHELMQKRRQSAVKTTFLRCWKSYKERAWGRDELTPISGGSKTTFGGWGATLVDSLDTLLIMDLKDEFHEAVGAVTKIDFKPGENEINMFETTIRYLGGLLSAYDLTNCKDHRLLEKAMELGDMIYASFDTPNRMPITRWNAKKAYAGETQEAASNGIIAEMASFSLEFTRLSQLTGDMRYYDAVTRITTILADQQNSTKLPGLWPVGIDVQKPDLTTGTLFSLGAMADSAYEYLGKTYQLLRGAGPDASQYKTLYTSSVNAIIPNLLFRPMTPDSADILMPTSLRVETATSKTQDHSAQHLVCYVGGMLLLGGRLFNNETHVSYGKKVTDGCIWAYKNSPNGIMPEMFSMPTCPFKEPCPFDPSIRQQIPGFTYISDARYMLRPEAIESVFYLYRITGDRAYQDIAWDMFQAIDTLSRTEFGNAAIRDVTRAETEVGLEDSMESFWLAETLKYFYLVFGGENVLSLDEWVFNTEAHPLRVV